MISATEFANGFSSIWQELTPNSDRIVRRLNLTAERYFDVLEGKSEPARHALVNEIGFELSKRVAGDQWPPDSFSPKSVDADVFETVKERLVNLPRLTEKDLAPMSDIEMDESLSICYRLVYFFTNIVKSRPEFSPTFPGCGYLFPSRGDVRTESTLFEIKSGARQFRSGDLRQLLVYCSANKAGNGTPIGEIGLLNPRMGVYFVWDLRAICFELGGYSPNELFDRVVFHLSSGDISR